MLFWIYRVKTKAPAKSPRLFSFMSRTSPSRRRHSVAPQARPQEACPKRACPKQARPKNARPKKPVPQTPRQRELSTKRRGELAELAFALKAAHQGLGVSRLYGDSERYDFILDARDLNVRRTLPSASSGQALSAAPVAPDPSPPLWRVQVKCSSQLSTGLYRVNAHRRSNGRAVPYLPGEIDFFAVYIIPEDTWYIIPLAATRGKTSLLFRRRRDPKPGLYDAYREAWHLLRP